MSLRRTHITANPTVTRTGKTKVEKYDIYLGTHLLRPCIWVIDKDGDKTHYRSIKKFLTDYVDIQLDY